MAALPTSVADTYREGQIAWNRSRLEQEKNRLQELRTQEKTEKQELGYYPQQAARKERQALEQSIQERKNYLDRLLAENEHALQAKMESQALAQAERAQREEERSQARALERQVREMARAETGGDPLNLKARGTRALNWVQSRPEATQKALQNVYETGQEMAKDWLPQTEPTALEAPVMLEEPVMTSPEVIGLNPYGQRQQAIEALKEKAQDLRTLRNDSYYADYSNPALEAMLEAEIQQGLQALREQELDKNRGFKIPSQSIQYPGKIEYERTGYPVSQEQLEQEYKKALNVLDQLEQQKAMEQGGWFHKRMGSPARSFMPDVRSYVPTRAYEYWYPKPLSTNRFGSDTSMYPNEPKTNSIAE